MPPRHGYDNHRDAPAGAQQSQPSSHQAVRLAETTRPFLARLGVPNLPRDNGPRRGRTAAADAHPEKGAGLAIRRVGPRLTDPGRLRRHRIPVTLPHPGRTERRGHEAGGALRETTLAAELSASPLNRPPSSPA